MHMEIKVFPGTTGQGGRLAARRREFEPLLREVPTLRNFWLAETREGVAVVVVAREPEAIAEAFRRLAGWITRTLPDLEWRGAFTLAGAVIADDAD
ncbi:MAG: hypothetical protein U0704_15795 [Candidatus Eisenbacteria bacterium]